MWPMIYRRSYRLGILLSPIHRPLQYCGEKYKQNDAKHYMMIFNSIIYVHHMYQLSWSWTGDGSNGEKHRQVCGRVCSRDSPLLVSTTITTLFIWWDRSTSSFSRHHHIIIHQQHKHQLHCPHNHPLFWWDSYLQHRHQHNHDKIIHQEHHQHVHHDPHNPHHHHQCHLCHPKDWAKFL